MSFDESRLRELQSALRAKMADNKTIADSFRVEGGTVIVDAGQKAAFDANMADIRQLKTLIEGLEGMKALDAWGAETPVESIAAAVTAGASTSARYGAKSLGQLFIESAEFKSLDHGRNGANMPAPFVLGKADIGSMWGQKNIYSDLPTGPNELGHFGAVQRDPMVIPPMRKSRVRDLFPARTTTAAIIEYFRMTGFTNAASTVPEWANGNFGRKPQSGFAFDGMQAPVRTIAHWEAAHRNVLADEPQLRSIIDNELLYGLRLQEDTQILKGNGQGENLLGILNTVGIQSYNWSQGATTPVADNRGDAIRRAATLAYLAFYEPTGVVVHPSDWERIELTKNSQGTYLFSVSMQVGGEARIWRMPIVDTPAMDEGTALVGAFGTAAQIYDREEANIRIAEQHADFFVRNAIVILAEQRLALAVKRPESMVRVTFDMAPA